MKAKLVALSMAAVALAMTGCSNDENEEMDNWNGEIRLSSGVAVQTRANTQAEQIQSGETVYAWVDKATTGESYINAWTLTAQGNGSFTGSSKYYPTDGSNLDFYALHGNFASDITEGGTEFPENGVVHSVEEYQVDADMKNYAKSDLLYAVKKGVTRSSDAVELPFYHMLSKVEVALKSGVGEPDLEGATVTIEGTKLNAYFRPEKDTDMTNPQLRAMMITVADGTPTPIKIRTAITENDFGPGTQYAEAVLVPQKISVVTFIKVKLQNDATFSYKIDGPLTLESGMKYTYKITVNQSGLSVSSEIKNWETAPDKAGEATMD